MHIDFRVAAEKPRTLAAYALCVPLGLFGAHRFYLGERRTAIMMLLLSITIIGLPVSALWVLVDLFLIPGIIRKRAEELRARLLAEAIG